MGELFSSTPLLSSSEDNVEQPNQIQQQQQQASACSSSAPQPDSSQPSGNNARNCLTQGTRYELIDLTVSADFFAHRFIYVEDFEAFLDLLLSFMVQSSLNEDKNPELVNEIALKIMKRTIEIHPSWERDLQTILHRFYRRESTGGSSRTFLV